MKLTKQQRQMIIRELIVSHHISSQDELSRMLRRQRVEVTQATLSRDLREMRIARMPEDNGVRYVLPEVAEGKKLRRVVQEEIVQIQGNECAILIKTLPGRAPGVGVFIDHLKHPDILGTVAGNDTLLVVPASMSKTQVVIEFLRNLGASDTKAEGNSQPA
ncbi:MAG: arginine repressor [candidate division KSB1 bacterium]|nr:arginine repressor [candidate division KSB1 bacterium]MDZ7272548.1 arginine repressor [candidate division KSB1 bacterium]MDZ7284429.1 arginine repressor [candidate division KSB1 bacterium]MDZ7297175.1 arginine repressor [candidate division KSB1 bacterium]MDZ7306686.1 arginine repressor [candidate division KSB1 bacterium]